MADVRARIASRACPPGTRLPSVRAQAQAMKLSVSTVLEAYERLAADGVLTSRRGSGFFVAGTVAPLALAALGPQVDRAVDPRWVSRTPRLGPARSFALVWMCSTSRQATCQ